MFFVVFGILQADSNGVLMAVLLAAGAAFLIWFFLYTRARERAGKEPLLPLALFKNRIIEPRPRSPRTSNGCCSWASRSRSPCSCKTVRGYNAIETGVIFTAATLGVLRLLARRRATRQAAPAEDADHRGLRGHGGRDRAPARPGRGLVARRRVRARAAADRPRPRGHADALGQRRAVQLPRAVCRARSPGCRGASPTSARRSARRSPARSWSPTSPRETRPTSSRWSPWPFLP